MSAQIAYRCTAPSHQTVKADMDHLTIRDREWAYCPYDSMAKGHQWASLVRRWTPKTPGVRRRASLVSLRARPDPKG